jgi:hypothetical protein
MSFESTAVAGRAGTQPRSTSRRAFARHFGEMMLVMFIGMGVLGGLATLAFAAFGGSLSDQSGALRVALMGVYMTVPMVAWMSYRGHSGARNAEMAWSMIAPTLAAAALAAAGLLSTDSAFAVQHAVMIPAMFGVMLWRYEDYAQRHRAA